MSDSQPHLKPIDIGDEPRLYKILFHCTSSNCIIRIACSKNVFGIDSFSFKHMPRQKKNVYSSFILNNNFFAGLIFKNILWPIYRRDKIILFDIWSLYRKLFNPQKKVLSLLDSIKNWASSYNINWIENDSTVQRMIICTAIRNDKRKATTVNISLILGISILHFLISLSLSLPIFLNQTGVAFDTTAFSFFIYRINFFPFVNSLWFLKLGFGVDFHNF